MSEPIPIILDTETNDTTDNSEPVEISYSTPTETFDFFLKPTSPCTPATIVVHGITNEQLEQCESITTGLIKAVDFLFTNQENSVLIGHNIKFDIDVLTNAIRKHAPTLYYNPRHSIDTIKIARKLIPIDKIGSYSLDTVFYYLFPDRLDYLFKSRIKHSAKTDIELTGEVFNSLRTKLNELKGKTLSLYEIESFSKEPMIIELWPFGKHKGKKIDEVLKFDYSYVEWFLYKADFRNEWPDLLFTLQSKGRR